MKRFIIAALVIAMAVLSTPVHAQNMERPYRELALPNTTATALAWNKDGSKLLIGADNGSISIWTVGPDSVSAIGNNGAAINSVAWSHDGTRVLATSQDGSVIIWDVASGEKSVVPQNPNFEPLGALWNRDETQILITGNVDKRGHIYIWDIAKKRNVMDVSVGDDPFTIGAAWGRDDTRIVAGTVNGVAYEWDAATGKQLFEFTRPGMVTGVAWNARGSEFLTTSISNALFRWDDPTGRRLMQYTVPDAAQSALTEGGTWNADGKLVIAAANTNDGAAVYGWYALSGKLVFEIQIGQVLFHTLAVGPGALIAAAQARDGSYVRVWNTL